MCELSQSIFPGRSEITKCTFLHVCTEGRRFIKTFPIKELLADVYIFAYIFLYLWASLVAQTVRNLPAKRETWVQFLGQEDSLEKERATPVFLPRESPWTEEPDGLQSMGL